MPRIVSLPRQHSLLVCLMALLLTLGASATAGEPFRFDWPVPCRVGVTSHSQRNDLDVVYHGVAHLYRTPHPRELKLQMEDLQLWDAHYRGRRVLAMDPILTRVMAVMSYQPAVVVSPNGKYLRIAFDRDAQSRALTKVRSAAGNLMDSAAWSSFRAALLSTEGRTTYDQDLQFSWNVWVGAWTGLDLEPGNRADAALPIPLAPGETIERPVSVTHLGPGAMDRHLAGLLVEANFGGEETRSAMERWLRRSKEQMGDTVLPHAPLLRSATVAARAIAFVEPRTIRPSFAGSFTIVRMEDSTGSETFSTRADVDYFEWDPPLSATRALDEVPKRGLELFFENKLEQANDEFEGAVHSGARNPETYAYLAETCRRLDRLGDAALFARRALTLSPHHAFAHQVLADAYNPQYSNWFRADPETTWAHLLWSIECDSTDANPWLPMVLEAQRRGRRDLEDRGLGQLLETEFITPALLAYTRWTLRDLPESTLLVTNGDMDTYPAWALQRVRSYRPDVAIANRSLLNRSWYARNVRDRLGVPLPFEDAALDTLAPYSSPTDSTVVYAADQILRGWVEMRRSGALRRPLAIAVTVSEASIPREAGGRIQLAGPVWMCVAESARSEVDTTAARRSLQGLNPADFRGPLCAARDRSPMRRSSGPRMVDNIAEAWCRYAGGLAAAGQREAALTALSRAAAFARDAGMSASTLDQIAEYERAVRARASTPARRGPAR